METSERVKESLQIAGSPSVTQSALMQRCRVFANARFRVAQFQSLESTHWFGRTQRSWQDCPNTLANG